jgi:hypothetical protein
VPNPNPNRDKIKEFEFKQADGIEVSKKAICCKFSIEADTRLRKLKDRSSFIREAVDEKLSFESGNLEDGLSAIAGRIDLLLTKEISPQNLKVLNELKEKISDSISQINSD